MQVDTLYQNITNNHRQTCINCNQT